MTNQAKSSNPVRFHTIVVSVPTDFARVAANNLWLHLRDHLGVTSTTRIDGFADDPMQVVTVRFMATDSDAVKVKESIHATFDFEE